MIDRVKLKEGYILREFGGEFNVFQESDVGGAVISMNSINELGCFLWYRLKDKATYNELIHAVAVRNDSDEEEAAMEVEEFLAKLINAGVAEIVKKG